ncbi:type IV toxin-antitoxin system AbiEi family antitoxin [Mesorhizobium sp. CAU 1732]|uniref:type IV toxin-antitoxin system AbiEi family antitoxin n=1 Tax=Mesorhizobium sp. CAU 1732 TaxID=3140358 RepID=UPI003260D22D
MKGIDIFHQRNHFQQMLKATENVKQLEGQAADAVQALLRDVPVIRTFAVESAPPGSYVDLVVRLNLDGHERLLVCEVKSIGQPRHVRAALLQLQKVASSFDPPATPIFIAPYLSTDAQALCREFDVGFVDLVGNARVTFDSVFIERQVDAKPPAVQRSLKSIFKPKSAQVLRVLLREPARAWRVADLAEASGVSLGHVSNVRGELVDRELAEVADDGLRLSHPDRLLDAWREAYEPPLGERVEFYTTLHGQPLDHALRSVLHMEDSGSHAVLASFSAAHWLSPYGRVPTQYCYADAGGLVALRSALKMAPARSGANVVVTVLKDHGVFLDAVEPAPGVFCTSPVQTYLDLAFAGERGAEAADHLRQELLAWRK